MTAVSAGETYYVSSGTQSEILVERGGVLIVEKGGTVSGTAVFGITSVVSGGYAFSTGVYSGGQMFVSGTAYYTDDDNAYVLVGGSHGEAYYGVVESGGTEVVEDVAYGTTLETGGKQLVYGGATTDVQVYDGSEQIVNDTGFADATSVFAGGDQLVYGVAQNTLIDGGTQQIGNGQQDFVDDRAASETVSNGNVYVYGGEFAEDAGLTSDTTLRVGGTEYLSGGLSRHDIISSGGAELVYGSGTATSASVRAGGKLTVFSGGFAVSAAISRGGTINVSSGAHTTATTVSGGGEEVIWQGATTTGTRVASGGKELVIYTGTASGTVVSTGGTEIVSGGATSIYGVIDGGTVDLLSNGSLGAEVTFIGSGGDLDIKSSGPAATISGFAAGDHVTLAKLTYSASERAVVKTSGVVTISGGAHIYNVYISGAAVGETNFTLSAGTGGGTVLGLSGALGAAVHMTFLAPTTAAGTGAEKLLPSLSLAAAYHQQTLGRVTSADLAPHAASAYLAGSIPDLLTIPRGGTALFAPAPTGHPGFGV